ncbi:hypothetical protein THII_1941 [Thioploca ingrica]|uniref:RiboL-PSP-HEPN domain-containing protein n=1 Tax=Thioploca ingrica TaxID=40754 RepID=A0A090AE43_9GAMM|nr:hypothetical protein THII_1941 [Thioploca ingrica]
MKDDQFTKLSDLTGMSAMEVSKFKDPLGISAMETANGLQSLVQRASELSKMELFLDKMKSISGFDENLVCVELEQKTLQFSHLMEEHYDDCVIDDIATITEYRANFNNAIADIEKLLDSSIDSTIENCFYRLLYANVITALETYLSDAFINAVLPNPSFIRRLVESTPEFKKEKTAVSDIYKTIEGIKVKAREYLVEFLWHKLSAVRRMYKDTLNINFPNNMGAVYKAILTRHNIVHRNGKDKSGEEKVICRQDVTNLIAEIEALVQHVDSLLSELKLEFSLNHDALLEQQVAPTDTKNIWDAIQTFRNQLEPGDLEPDEDVFAEVRDSSPGREVSF